MKKIFTSTFIIGILISGNAQHFCGTTEVYNQVVHDHPEVLQEQEQLENFTQQYQLNFKGNNTTSAPIYTIPVVFHILHQYGTENISEQQINDQMRILNEDFQKLNADVNTVAASFQGISADAQIQFMLARKDPNGNCHTGIDRIVSPETNIGDDGSKLNSWPRNKYLNVWVVKTISSGAAGYAYLPGTAPSAAVDGLMMLSTYIGSIGTGNPSTSHTLTHEVGHFFNLQHTWGNTNQPGVSCGNDGVSDTPVTKGWTTCNLTNNDVCTSGVDENVENFMEYSFCFKMFTAQQATRMQACLNNTAGQRNQLPTTSNLAATGVDGSMNNVTCAPIADYIATFNYACTGTTFTYKNYNWGGRATSYNWSFTGGTPSSSTDSIPLVVYNTPGTYSSSMTVSNGSGSNTQTRTNYVTAFSPTAQYNSFQYYEGFESGSIPNNDWTVINPQSNAWTVSNTAFFTGANSVRLTNTTANSSQIDEFFGPSINLVSIPSPIFTFKVAFAQRTTSNADRLRVLVSTDCGRTWVPRLAKSGTNLKTVNPTNVSFVPNSQSQWRTETINLASYVNSTNVRIKFEFTSDGGNNIYIDDINILGASSINDEFENAVAMTLFPNPTDANSTVSFNVLQTGKISLQITDMIGRMVDEIYNGEMIAGEQQLFIPTENMSKGIYTVMLNIDGRIVAKKLIVN
jgi:hypothetical protein